MPVAAYRPLNNRRFSAAALREGALKRLSELGGLVLGVVALGLLAALLTYNPQDPSWDTATSAPATNLLGATGAKLADWLLQNLGLAAALPPFALLAWCWRIASHRGLGSVVLRLVATVLVLPVASAVLAGLSLSSPGHAAIAWPTVAGPGGALGGWIAGAALGSGRAMAGLPGAVLVWLLGLALTGLLVMLSFGLSAGEWRAAGRGAGHAARLSVRGGRHAASWFGSRGQGAVASPSREAEARHTPRMAEPGDPAGPSPFARAASGGAGALVPVPDPVEQTGRRPRRAARTEPRMERRTGGIEVPEPRPRAMPGTGYVLPPGLAELPDDMPLSHGQAAYGSQAHDAQGRESLGHGSLGHGSGGHGSGGRAMVPVDPPRGASGAGAALSSVSAAVLSPLRGLLTPRGEPPAGTAPQMRDMPRGRAEAERAGAAQAGHDGYGHARGHGHGGGQGHGQGHGEGHGPWSLPGLDLLKPVPSRAADKPSEASLQANARLLETVLSDYGVQGAIVGIHAGPVVTLYELEPAPGIRSARVIGLADDVARSLCVTAVRIATVPGRNVIGIEVPNARRETVYFAELLSGADWHETPSRLCLALGKDISGAPIYADLARMPHLLIAGTTGSGKSVGVNAMILSLLYRMSPDECRLILIDPKMLELSIYDGIPHLMAPVVTEPAKAVTALKWTVREMERRYRAMSQLGVRNVGGYNEKIAQVRARGESISKRVQTGFDPETGKPIFEEQTLSLDALPYIVVVIDEMADLMMVAGKEIEQAVQRLAQMARAAGIHVIAATQRPSVDVITGTIKANFPTRISFQVISKFDSRTILGEQGAEQLLGQGDMLYMQGGGRITRVHGPFVNDNEVEEVVRFLRAQGEPAYLDEVTSAQEDEAPSGGGGGNGLGGGNVDGETGLFDQAVALVAREGKASTSFIQRHLSIGYNRAAKLIEQMEKEGIVGPANHVGKREVLVRRTEDDT